MASETQSLILQAARELFTRQGYTATAMHEIAEAAGIGKATIYHHFRGKEEILLSLVETSLDELHEALKPIYAIEDPRQLLRTAAEGAIGFLYSSTDLIQTARREVPAVREMMVGKLVVLFAEFTSALEDTFRKGMAMGIFRQIDPHETAIVFLTLIQGNFARFYLTRLRSESPKKAVDELLNVFYNGINAASEDRETVEKE